MNRPLAVTALAIVAASSLLATSAFGVADAPSARSQKVLVIGIDGAMLSKIQAFNTPAMKELIRTGSAAKTSLYAAPFAPTVSGPGWATNATGVWPDKHQVKSNNWGTGSKLTQYPDFLTRLERARPELSTYAIADWTPLTTNSAGQAIFSDEIQKKVTYDGDALGYTAADAKIATEAAAYLKDTGPDASFVYFGDVDIAGHSCGAAGACYRTATEQTDKHIATLLSAVRARPTYANEDWTILVTADHGHTESGGHGGSSVAERSSFIIRNGPGTTPGTPAVAPKNVDIAAIVLGRFGVSAPEIDGQANPAADPFDSLVGSLQSRVDETGVPADVKGWTHSTPAGWAIDNAGLGTGGVREWQGWSFTTDDFWTRAAPDQSREGNVRARGVFAVADSDEWSDKSRSGLFNSKLVSPSYDVTGATTAAISFSSHYLKSGNETATVLVSFDNAAAKPILTYTADAIAKQERLTVPVPAGARNLKVTWSLANGDNDWYWAIDNPQIGR
ncbi:nucleotide pyrophosphatase [Kribbella antibiotica]|uniref:Nucleotide pyrophosphatase n=1 Tax=Kribbella antibiotica TaxID=190195 RepID=A0A4R4ZI90_9ACTN|nr:alkaline phosphatase family protein [Kribbella antibiotica]TDD56342.1 nucleotide pyrophosphatase [Kribbella antibiotica]